MKKRPIVIVLVLILVIALAAPVIAATTSKEAILNYRDIKITLDGQAVTPKDANGNIVEPFIIDGTTYLPVRAVSDALGLNAEWDSTTSTVKLKTGDYNEPENSNTDTYSRTNPAPVGTEQTFTVKDYSGEYNITMKIKYAYRGQVAWAFIREANRYNETPTASREYVLIAVEATVNSVSSDKAVNFSKYDFTPFSRTNSEYELVATVNPTPEFGGKAYAGGTIEGFLSFVVDTDDTNPKVVFGADYDGTGGAWFSLVEE